MNGIFPASTPSLALRIRSMTQGFRIGLVRSATRYVGWPWPLGTYGWALSKVTGPGPLGGGRKSSWAGRSNVQAVLLSGVKLGMGAAWRFAPSAASAGH